MPQLWSAPQSADPAPIGGLRASAAPRFYPPSSTCHPQVHEMLDGAALGGLVDKEAVGAMRVPHVVSK